MNCFQIISCLIEANALIDSIHNLFPQAEELDSVYAGISELTSTRPVFSSFPMARPFVPRRRVKFAPVIRAIPHGFCHRVVYAQDGVFRPQFPVRVLIPIIDYRE